MILISVLVLVVATIGIAWWLTSTIHKVTNDTKQNLLENTGTLLKEIVGVVGNNDDLKLPDDLYARMRKQVGEVELFLDKPL